MKQQTKTKRLKRGLLVLTALLLAVTATFAGVMPTGEAKAINYRHTFIDYIKMKRITRGLYRLNGENGPPLTLPNRVCGHIYIERSSIYSPHYTKQEANFRVRYYHTNGSSFVDTDAGKPPYYWVPLLKTSEQRLARVGVCVKAGTKYKIETDRPVSFEVWD